MESDMGVKPYQRLSLRIDFGSVQRVARYDLYIGRQVFFECCKLRGLAGGLTTDDRTDLGCLMGSSSQMNWSVAVGGI